MRLFTGISRTTLDSFHRDVYRPRLALLLLILLLIIGQQEQHRARQDVVVGQTMFSLRNRRVSYPSSSGSHSARLARQIEPLLARIPDRLRLDKSTVAIRWVKKHDEQRTQQVQAKANHGHDEGVVQDGRVTGKKALIRNERESDAEKESSRALRRSKSLRKIGGNAAAKSRGKSRSSRSLLAKVLNADALSAILSLHALWAIRLGSMILEDILGKEPVPLSHSPNVRSNAYVVLWLAASAFLALAASMYSWADTFQRMGIARRADGAAQSMSVQAITLLELSATLVSLLSPLCRLCDPRLLRFFPQKVSLPSPSHSPSLIDLLPIPASLADAFKGNNVPAQSMRNRQRMTAYWSAPNLHGRRLIAAPVVPRRHGNLLAAVGPEDMAHAPAASPATGLAEPLRMPTAGKAPRLSGMRVNVDTSWLLENFVILYGHIVGALQYVIIVLSLPTLAPTSFPSLLSLLSLRSELGAVTSAWSSARKSVECLEFVRRRWSTGRSDSSMPRRDTSVCSICFETVGEGFDREDCCLLDCGHELHSICLVQWLTKQAFCPCCHATLKATPSQVSATGLTTAARS